MSKCRETGAETPFVFPDETVRCAVRYGSVRRRRILIRIVNHDVVEVLLPPGLPLKEAEAAVYRRRDWIAEQLDRLRRNPAPPAYRNGEEHLYLGRVHRLDILSSRARQGVHRDDGRLVINCRSTDPNRIRRLLIAWLHEQAEKVFAARFAALAADIPWLTAVPPWRVRTMRRRWGSCTADGRITLNTRLVQTDPCCIDYVLLHEIAHLRELNHGPQFYALLENLLPDWRDARNLLRRREHVLRA